MTAPALIAALLLLGMVAAAAWGRRPRPPAALLSRIAAQLQGAEVRDGEIHGAYQGSRWRLEPLPGGSWRLHMEGMPPTLSVRPRVDGDDPPDGPTGDPTFDRALAAAWEPDEPRLLLAALPAAARQLLLKWRDGLSVSGGTLSRAVSPAPTPATLEESHHLIRLCRLPDPPADAQIEARLRAHLSDPIPSVRRRALTLLILPLPPAARAALLHADNPEIRVVLLDRADLWELSDDQRRNLWRALLLRLPEAGEVLPLVLRADPAILLDALSPAACERLPPPVLQLLLTKIAPTLPLTPDASGPPAPNPNLASCLVACLRREEAEIANQALSLIPACPDPALLPEIRALLDRRSTRHAARRALDHLRERHGGGALSLTDAGGLSLSDAGSLSLPARPEEPHH